MIWMDEIEFRPISFASFMKRFSLKSVGENYYIIQMVILYRFNFMKA